MWLIGAAAAAAELVILIRRRRAPLDANSAYGHWQREQSVLWHGRPVTVTFDYAPYLKEPVRRRVNVHALQESAMGERSLVGFCHDGQEERAFKLAGIQGEILIERSHESISFAEWLEQVLTGRFENW